MRELMNLKLIARGEAPEVDPAEGWARCDDCGAIVREAMADRHEAGHGHQVRFSPASKRQVAAACG